jgi:hypothetical protein
VLPWQFPIAGQGLFTGSGAMEDELTIPITTAAEDLFTELREQTTVSLLSEGLLRYTDPSFATAAPPEESEDDLFAPAAD